jgi:hypothetical protein
VIRDAAAAQFVVAELLERSGVWNVDVEVLGERGDLQYHDFVIAKGK